MDISGHRRRGDGGGGGGVNAQALHQQTSELPGSRQHRGELGNPRISEGACVCSSLRGLQGGTEDSEVRQRQGQEECAEQRVGVRAAVARMTLE